MNPVLHPMQKVSPERSTVLALLLLPLFFILMISAFPQGAPRAANLPVPSIGSFSEADLARARAEAMQAPPLAPGWENPNPARETPSEPLLPHGNGDNDPCHYVRGTTLVVHIFVSHTGGTWTGAEMSAAAARARTAKDWYRNTGPYNANIRFDCDGSSQYVYYYASVNYNIPPDGMTYGIINEILTSWGFVDADGDGAQVDDFTYMLQNWGGGWDNVITTWEPRQTGRAWSGLGLGYCIVYFNDGANVFAHEWGHQYGACDEYVENGHCDGGTDCGTCGTPYLQNMVPNSNCALASCPMNIPCMMKNADWAVCPYTNDIWAWRDTDNNGVLDYTHRYVAGGSYVDILEIAENGYFSWNSVTDGMMIAQRWRNWAVVGVRSPSSSDYDMILYGDNGHNFTYASSAEYAGRIDFVVGDYYHAPLGNEHIQLFHYSGPWDTYQLDFDGASDLVYPDGIERAGSLQSIQFLKIYDVPLFQGERVRFTAGVQTAGLDIGMALFRSNGAPFWTGRAGAVAEQDWNGPGLGEEFEYTVPADDVYGLVVYSNTNIDGNFTLRIGGWPVTLAEETPVMTGGDLQLYNYDPNAIYWSFVGCQPDPGTDAHMRLYDDQNYQVVLDVASEAGAGAMEFFAVDYNHSSLARDYLRVIRDSGGGSHTMEWEHDPEQVPGIVQGWWSTYHLGKVWDAWMDAGKRYFLREYHAFDTPLDSGIYIFSSGDGDYYKSKGEAAAWSDSRPAADGGEWTLYDPPASDWYGIYDIMNNSTSASGSYSLWLGPKVTMPENALTQQTEPVLWGEVNSNTVYWTVYAARPDPGGAVSVWLYGDPAYTVTTTFATDQSGGAVAYVVSDHNHSPLGVYYPRFLKTSGTSMTCQWEMGPETLSFTPGGTNTYDLTWGAGSVAAMWDIYVDASNPGGRSARFEVSDLSGSIDFGTAFFASNGGTYFGDPSSAVASADAAGPGGTESVTVHLNQADWYGLVVTSKSLPGGPFRIRVIDAGATGVEAAGAIGFGLRPLTANPFTDRIELEASLPGAGDARVGVYDVQGRLVRRLAERSMPAAGRLTIRWDGNDEGGKAVAGGVYFATLSHGSQQTRLRLVRSP